ncbi:MAG: AAC(3) family N-acetyltransferase [Planctomycetales bacterium]|nr:AAC(3) family N-acetyltransferase [Planctomycetales bacterium]
MGQSSADHKLSLADLIDRFRRIGLTSGQGVLVHSALLTVGNVNGGASTVVEALLEILGSDGTLVVPTFTLAHESLRVR